MLDVLPERLHFLMSSIFEGVNQGYTNGGDRSQDLLQLLVLRVNAWIRSNKYIGRYIRAA